jgi:hypothetical protein
MNLRLGAVGVSLVLAATVIACSASTRGSGFQSDQNPTNPDAGPGGFGGAPSPLQGCSLNDDVDHDGDGLSGKAGDCNDCDPRVHPAFFDFPGNGVDEDCSGTADDGEDQCDDGLPIDPDDPYDAAKAMGLCKKADASKGEWGITEAKFVRPDGKSASVDLDVGILTKFGVNAPQSGSSMLVLSTGYARGPSDPGYQVGTSRTKGTTHGAPPGYPKEFAGCPAGTKSGSPQDGIALQVKVIVPKNAQSFSYDQNFFTYEFPNFICQRFNDFFVTMMDPKLPDLPDGNIAFDSKNNPISVNNAFIQVCKAQQAGGKNFTCPLGQGPLKSTGFDSGPHGATGWLTTTAPVESGTEITLRFAIWDSGDGNFDSTVLLDNFKWSVDPTSGAVTAPVVK